MTQIVVTLENDADENLLRHMIENMKGVLKTSVKANNDNKTTGEWIHKMKELSETIDKSYIDMNDERTRYIMSK